MAPSSVFANLKVADFSSSVVGPGAARLLAAYGATVVRVESRAHVDAVRAAPPYKGGIAGLNRSGYFNNFNAGKYGLSLNMRAPKALEIARRLVEWADVVIETFRPGIMAKWGLDYESLVEVKPDLIMVSSTMLGQTGPDNAFRGYGQHGAALAGWGTTLGYPEGEAIAPFSAYTDYIGLRYVAIAVIAALEYRRRTGQGQYIDNSQVECSLGFLSQGILDYQANHRVPQISGNRDPSAAPHGAYRCLGEDRWCALAATTEEDWRSFCAVLGDPAWTADPRFESLAARKEHEDELDRLVEEWTRAHPPEAVVEMMQQAGVAASVVADAQDLAESPQLEHRNHFVNLEHSEVGFHHYENFAFTLSETPGAPKTAAPCLGEHNDHVCTRILGLTDEEFVELLTEGVLE
jgi:crotonobetainyl-CoA:carnitine CoA-transferase CaiB-like acyl-CoA transferase